MIHEVKVFSPSGHLEKIISRKTLLKKDWESIGYTPPKKTARQRKQLERPKRPGRKIGEFQCGYCPTIFESDRKSTTCSPRCKQQKEFERKHTAYNRKRDAKPIVMQPCMICKKPFKKELNRTVCHDAACFKEREARRRSRK